MSKVYIPKIRKIFSAVDEMRVVDPQTVITRHFIETLIDSGQLTANMYGDAWVINLDELYGLLYVTLDVESLEFYRLQSDYVMRNTGEIYHAFLEQDPNTLIRKPNLRRFVKRQNIPHCFLDNTTIINFNELLNTLNPKQLTHHIEMPRLRWHDNSVRGFKKTHPDLPVTINIVEQAFRSNNVFKTKNGGRWIINYDELEIEVLRIIKDKQPPN